MFDNWPFSEEEFESCELVESVVATADRFCMSKAQLEGRLTGLGSSSAKLTIAPVRPCATWLNRPTDIHPVIVSAIAQLQLVHIHPFLDGNGHTSRLEYVLAHEVP